MMPKQKTKISLWTQGEDHKDAGNFSNLLDTLRKLNEQNIPFVFCAEAATDDDLDARIKTYSDDVANYEKWILYPQIKKHLKKEGEREYFDVNDYQILAVELNKILKGKLTPASFRIIYGYDAFKEYLAIFKYLKENKNPYFGIDDTKANRAVLLSGRYSPEDLINYENKRIQIMLDNITQKGIPVLKDGGVLICKVGAMHAQRLAAGFMLRTKDNPHFDFAYFTPIAFSEYIKNLREADLDYIERSKRIDSEEITTLGKKVNCHIIDLKRTSQGFADEKIDELFKEAVEHIKPSKELKPDNVHQVSKEIEIPEWNVVSGCNVI